MNVLRVIIAWLLLTIAAHADGWTVPSTRLQLAQTLLTPNLVSGSQAPTLIMPTPNDVRTNWAKAGLAVIGGIPNRTTQCGSTVNPSGKIPPQANDDATLINAAIQACSTNQVVQLGAGTFQISTTQALFLNKPVVLRGTGNCTVTSLGANPTTTGTVPLCQTVIQHYDGAWSVQNGAQCGSTTGTPPGGTAPGTLGSCPGVFGSLINVSPQTVALVNFGWGGCLLNGNDPRINNCGSKLAADVAQGATTVQVASTSNFSVGMFVMIDEQPQWVSTANPTGHGNANVLASSDWLSSNPSPSTIRLARPDGGCDSNYGLCDSVANTDRFNHEIKLIASIGAGPCPGAGCTLTFDSPVTVAFRQSNDPTTGGSYDARVYWPQIDSVNTPFLQQAGVENLTISRAVNGPLTFTFCAYCWAKNVETSYWVNGANVNFSARVQITGSFLHDCADCANDGAEYPLGINAAATEVLADNNIILFGGKGMVGRASGGGNVVAYNYVDWQRYQPSAAADGFLDMGANGSHEIGVHHWLLEGNRASNCDNDNTHGNAMYHTYFRDHCVGLRADFVDALNCNNLVSDINNNAYVQGTCALTHNNGPLRAFGPMSFNYWMAYIGNVGGLAGVSTTGGGWVYFRCSGGSCGNQSQTNRTIYMSGWSNPDWGYGDANLDGTTASYYFKNSNYDYVTAGIPSSENPPSGYSGSLPNSLYLSAAPSYFTGASCTYPWPPVTPQSGTVLPLNSCSGNGIPAKARWDAGTPLGPQP